MKFIETLTFERMEAGRLVFEAGKPGDKFYIILHGTVTVYVVKKQ